MNDKPVSSSICRRAHDGTALGCARHLRNIGFGIRTDIVHVLLVVALVAGALLSSPALLPEHQSANANTGGLRVQGTQLVDSSGNPVRLIGVNRSGTEYAAIQGWGFHEADGFAPNASTVRQIKSWNTNVIRVPLNEHSWLARNGAPSQYSGQAYRNAIRDWVNTIAGEGMYVILELHWSGAGSTRATGQQPMPNRDHTVEFWRQVATEYANHPQVIFDLFNEPYPDNNRNTSEAWRCWRDGGSCAGMNFQAAGMQELTDTVRATGARNLILLGGLQYSNTLTRWQEYKPNDPVNNTAAKWHSYDFNWYTTPSEWEQTVGGVMRNYPLVAAEIGGTASYLKNLMDWLDARNAGYLAWTWNIWGSPYDLISDRNGNPTNPFGRTFRDHIAGIDLRNPSSGGSGSQPSTPSNPSNPPAPAQDHAWVSPSTAAELRGRVTLEARGNADYVEFFWLGDWDWIGRDNSGSDGWSIRWDTTRVRDGNYTLVVLFRRNDSTIIADKRVNVSVRNNTSSPTPTQQPAPPQGGNQSPPSGGTGSGSNPDQVSESQPVLQEATNRNAFLSAAERVWNRTDRPVREGAVKRTWMWGPQPFTDVVSEPYAESSNGKRDVQYFDKSRMEVNDAFADSSSTWYVTNGLLSQELVTGQMQVGDDQFENREPARVNVAGDPDDPDAPTYASLNGLLDAPPHGKGATITQTVDRNGRVGDDASLGKYGVVAAARFEQTNHRVASVFWDFMNSSGLVYQDGAYREGRIAENPLYVTGLPITEAYWATVNVNGTPQPVLMQVFERRVLTYTPGNPDGWQVEAGNIGRHYYEWRYGEKPSS